MTKSRLILPILAILSFRAQAQDFYWTQYANENPAAAAVDSRFAASSITTLRSNNLISERLAVEARIRKLHGGFSAGYNFNGRLDNTYSYSSPFLNYSYHIKTGDNSMLALGAGVEYFNQRFSSAFAGRYEGVRFKTGAHFQYKGLKTGIAFETYEREEQGIGVRLSNFYLDYTLKFGTDWALNAGIFAGRYESGIQLRTTFRDKYWFGLNHDLNERAGLAFGMNLNENWSLGYSFSMQYNDPTGNLRVQHGLMLKFRLPNNE